jgi:hypothetical protein
MFTPTNIEANWILSHFGLIEDPRIKGIHWTRPAMIAKIAPIDST